jgi:hypothetical protein
MQTKWIEPSELCAARLAKAKDKNAVNLITRHLTRRHRKLAMADFAEPADVAIDCHVVGWVSEDHLRPLAFHQSRDDGGIERIATHKPVWAKPPDVAEAAARGNVLRIRKPVIRWIA